MSDQNFFQIYFLIASWLVVAVCAVGAVAGAGSSPATRMRRLMALGGARFLSVALVGSFYWVVVLPSLLLLAVLISDRGMDYSGTANEPPHDSRQQWLTLALVAAVCVLAIAALITVFKAHARALRPENGAKTLPPQRGGGPPLADFVYTLLIAGAVIYWVLIPVESLAQRAGTPWGEAGSTPSDQSNGTGWATPVAALLLVGLALATALFRWHGRDRSGHRVIIDAALITAAFQSVHLIQLVVMARATSGGGPQPPGSTLFANPVMHLGALLLAWLIIGGSMGRQRADIVGLALPSALGKLVSAPPVSLTTEYGETYSTASLFAATAVVALAGAGMSMTAAWLAYRTEPTPMTSPVATTQRPEDAARPISDDTRG